ncbi:hypothetical protein [Pseudomonas sp. AMR01]|uniref:hypothetical protein n=1 Tax=Pseudomonas sp. AMR01 TaxID=3064904 RepID=UPI0035BF17E1
MEKASFSIEKYLFSKVNIDLENHTSNKRSIDFKPSGVFKQDSSTYDLTFDFSAYTESDKDAQPFVTSRCIGTFKFSSLSSFEEIPSYFYRNSIAILFPYLRAFVSMVTIQANIPPVVLPTMNLASLEVPLKENTKIA